MNKVGKIVYKLRTKKRAGVFYVVHAELGIVFCIL